MNETDDGSPSSMEGALEGTVTVAERDTTTMAEMGVVTKAVVGAASEIELAITAGSVAASEVVMADIVRNVEYSILLVMSELSTVRCDCALGLWIADTRASSVDGSCREGAVADGPFGGRR